MWCTIFSKGWFRYCCCHMNSSRYDSSMVLCVPKWRLFRDFVFCQRGYTCYSHHLPERVYMLHTTVISFLPNHGNVVCTSNVQVQWTSGWWKVFSFSCTIWIEVPAKLFDSCVNVWSIQHTNKMFLYMVSCGCVGRINELNTVIYCRNGAYFVISLSARETLHG